MGGEEEGAFCHNSWPMSIESAGCMLSCLVPTADTKLVSVGAVQLMRYRKDKPRLAAAYGLVAPLVLHLRPFSSFSLFQTCALFDCTSDTCTGDC